MMYKYTVTLPDGGVHTRRTERTYTHVVAYCVDGKWRIVQWCGRPDLADKALRQVRPNSPKMEKFPVDNPRPAEQKTITETLITNLATSLVADLPTHTLEALMGRAERQENSLIRLALKSEIRIKQLRDRIEREEARLERIALKLDHKAAVMESILAEIRRRGG